MYHSFEHSYSHQIPEEDDDSCVRVDYVTINLCRLDRQRVRNVVNN